LFRGKNIILFSYLKLLNLDDLIDSWRMYTKNIHFWGHGIFYLPGGLWLYSYVYAVGMSWHRTINTNNLFWYILPILVAVTSEFGQYFKVIRGTFDWVDVTCYLLSAMLALFTLRLKVEYQDTQVT
jgi:hypothetical protein